MGVKMLSGAVKIITIFTKYFSIGERTPLSG